MHKEHDLLRVWLEAMVQGTMGYLEEVTSMTLGEARSKVAEVDEGLQAGDLCHLSRRMRHWEHGQVLYI